MTVDGKKMAAHLGAIQNLAKPADPCEPRAQDTIGKASGAILILRPFPFQENFGLRLEGMGRVVHVDRFLSIRIRCHLKSRLLAVGSGEHFNFFD